MKKIPIKIYLDIVRNFVIQKSQHFDASYKDRAAVELQNSLLSFLSFDCNEILIKYEKIQYENIIEMKIPRVIWIFWWQGSDSINPFISACIQKMQKIKQFTVNIVTKDNINEFINIDDILPLYLNKKIFVQTLSDIVRMRLLRKYGGFWCDASIVVIDDNYFDYIVENFSFFTNHLKDFNPANNVSHGRYGGFFLATYPNNPALCFFDDCLSYFLLKHRGLIDYTQIDYIVKLGYLNLSFIRDLIDSVPFNNQDIWWLNSVLSKPFDKALWNEKIQENHIFKLSGKGIQNGLSTINSGTFCDYVMKNIL